MTWCERFRNREEAIEINAERYSRSSLKNGMGEEARERLDLLEALEYGLLHPRIAFGLDRLTMILSHIESIRDVCAARDQKGTVCNDR